jgi:hypothetical protein
MTQQQNQFQVLPNTGAHIGSVGYNGQTSQSQVQMMQRALLIQQAQAKAQQVAQLQHENNILKQHFQQYINLQSQQQLHSQGQASVQHLTQAQIEQNLEPHNNETLQKQQDQLQAMEDAQLSFHQQRKSATPNQSPSMSQDGVQVLMSNQGQPTANLHEPDVMAQQKAQSQVLQSQTQDNSLYLAQQYQQFPYQANTPSAYHQQQMYSNQLMQQAGIQWQNSYGYQQQASQAFQPQAPYMMPQQMGTTLGQKYQSPVQHQLPFMPMQMNQFPAQGLGGYYPASQVAQGFQMQQTPMNGTWIGQLNAGGLQAASNTQIYLRNLQMMQAEQQLQMARTQ